MDVPVVQELNLIHFENTMAPSDPLHNLPEIQQSTDCESKSIDIISHNSYQIYHASYEDLVQEHESNSETKKDSLLN